MRLTRLVIVVMLTTLVVGCSDPASERGTVQEQQATLAARPTIQEITAHYERMQTELRQRLVAEIGVSEWVKRSEPSASGCSDYPGIGGESRGLGFWGSDGNLPDARWPQALEIITEVTGDYGFTPPEIVVDRPSEHQIVGTDQYGATYNFGTAVNTSLSVATGCHRNPQANPAP